MAYVYDKYQPFRTYFDEYSRRWARLARMRRQDGILEVRFHTDDGPALFCEAMHIGYLGLLFDISHDPENELLIVTGTGDSFLARADDEMSFVDVHYPTSVTYDWWYLTATRVPLAWLDVPIPVICAVNGPYTIHPESVLLSDYIIAADTAYTVDRHLQDAGCAPTDGINILYHALLGPNASRALLMNGGVIDAEYARQLGIVAEVVPAGTELQRAWEFARDYLRKVPSPIVRRMTREQLVQPLREALVRELRASLAHECYSSELRQDARPEAGHRNMVTTEA